MILSFVWNAGLLYAGSLADIYNFRKIKHVLAVLVRIWAAKIFIFVILFISFEPAVFNNRAGSIMKACFIRITFVLSKVIPFLLR